jgi:hypothetical protein
MKIPFFFALLIVATLAEASPGSPRESVESLDDAQIQKAIDTLQSNYLSSEAMDAPSRQRALLEGLIHRLSPGIEVIDNQGDASAASDLYPFLAEILDERIGYIRLGALDASALTQMDAALGNFAGKSIGSLILDIRAIPAGSEFDIAAEFARRFCPKGKILFTIQKPNAKQERILTADKDPLFSGILIVLTDADTAGAAEALAATLRKNAGAMIVGMPTAGVAVEFAEFPLGAGKMLRVAVSQVLLPESGALFPLGIKPDLTVSMPTETQAKIFDLSREKGVSNFVFDIERPRMNEAALVANTNPEITGESDTPSQMDLRDRVLQRAVDMVTAIGFFKNKAQR